MIDCWCAFVTFFFSGHVTYSCLPWEDIILLRARHQWKTVTQESCVKRFPSKNITWAQKKRPSIHAFSSRKFMHAKKPLGKRKKVLLHSFQPIFCCCTNLVPHARLFHVHKNSVFVNIFFASVVLFLPCGRCSSIGVCCRPHVSTSSPSSCMELVSHESFAWFLHRFLYWHKAQAKPFLKQPNLWDFCV